MMRWLVESSLQFRILVVVAAGVIVFFGIQQLDNSVGLRQYIGMTLPPDAGIDHLPEYSPPFVEVQTEALGLSAEEVEALITTPLEADMLNGVPWLDEIRSESLPGLSSIVMIFQPGTEMMHARQVVQERLVAVHALPNVSKPPTMINPKSSTARVMNVGLTWLNTDGLSEEEMREKHVELSVLARWSIRPRLMGVPGVSNVSIWGQRKRQLQVLVDPEELAENDVTLQQVISTTGNALWFSPLTYLDAAVPGTGGWIETPSQRLGVRHLLPISTPEQLAEVNVEGTDLQLKDIAEVVETHQPLIGDGVVDGESNLMLVIEKFPEANTVEVARDVEDALKSLSLGLAGIKMDTTLYNPRTYLETSGKNIAHASMLGSFLVMVGLVVVLFDWRRAIIGIVSLAVAFFAAVLVLQWLGVQMNLLVVTGLAMASLVMIDDVILAVTNITRRLSQRRTEQTASDVILSSAMELRGAALFATVMIIAIVLPVFVMGGVYGSFFTEIALPYVVAVIVSMLVALTVTSVMCHFLLRGDSASRYGEPMIGAIQTLHDRTTGRMLTNPSAGFALVVVALIVCGLLAWRLKRDELLPNFKETDVAIHIDAIPGASRGHMVELVKGAVSELRNIPGVRDVSAHVGRAIMSDEIANVNSTELWVSIDPAAKYDTTMQEIQSVVDSYPGLDKEVTTYTHEMIDEALNDEPTEVTVRVYGDDYNVLRQKAKEVADMLSRVEGLADSEVDYPEVEPAINIQVDLERAKTHGVKPGDVRRQVTTLLSGIEVGNLFEKQKVFDVVVWGKPETRDSVTAVEKLLVETPSGDLIALADVADVGFGPAEAIINRDTVSRYVDVTAQVTGADYSAISADIRRSIAKVDFGLEYRAELLSGYADHLERKQRVATVGIAALIVVFLLLQASLSNWKSAIAVFLTVPMVAAGGLVAIWLTGSIVTLGAMAGLVAVIAVALRQTMVMVTHYQDLERDEAQEYGSELIVRGTRERSGALIVSILLMMLLVLPIIVLGDGIGTEMLYPMAVVVLGGLISLVLYMLIGLPSIYILFGASVRAKPDTESILMTQTPSVYEGPDVQPST